MGSCLQKSLQLESAQPVGIAQPPTEGLSGVEISHHIPGKTSVPKTRRREIVTQDEKLGARGRLKVSKKYEVHNAYRLYCFGYNTLKVATQKFSKKNLLGQGGSGEVYKGWIDFSTMAAAKPRVGHPIAVKRLKKEGVQGRQEWLTELNFLRRFNHPNVVKLIGYCCKGEHIIIVYEYMPRGSLESILLRVKDCSLAEIEKDDELNWRTRLKIAVGSAKGLAYLHMNGSPVIHRDMKSSNILLDYDFTPKISDFGLAKLGPQGDRSHISSRVLGTRGYFAPEYITTGHLTMRTDVYSLGVVLLEILSGRVAVNRSCSGVPEDLVEWGKPYLYNKQQLHHIIDKKMIRNFSRNEAYKFAKIIGQCLNQQPKRRPTMTEVVHVLEELEQGINRNQKSHTSRRTQERFYSQHSHSNAKDKYLSHGHVSFS